MLDTLSRDVRYAIRSFTRSPGFTATAVLTIALGIGATTAIFSIVYGVLLRPLPFPEPGRLVMLQPRTDGIDTDAMSLDAFLEWQRRSSAFEGIAGFTGRPATLTGSGEPELLTVAAVTVRFFDVLQPGPALGRTFVTAEGEAGRDDVAVLSDGFWRRRFQSDRNIAGRRITLDGRPVTVVGVMPAAFSFPEEVLGPRGRFRSLQRVDAWIPLVPQASDRGNAFLRVVARLRPDVTIAQAGSDAAAVAQTLATSRRNRNSTTTVVPLHEYIVGDARRDLVLLLGAVALLLVIACANVANLLVARAAARQAEIAVRSAIGASRGRLIRQFLTESTLLGLIGGACGVAVAIGLLRGLVTVIPRGALPRAGEVAIDVPVLAFTTLLSLATGLVFGLAPVVHTRRPRAISALQLGTPTPAPRLRMLKVLVASEVALAIVLIGPASLLVRSFARLTAVDPGFAGADVVSASVTLPPEKYSSVQEMARFHDAVLERLTNAPGVTGVAAVNWLPFGGNLLSGDIVTEGSPAGSALAVGKIAVSPDYFRMMGIQPVKGRMFSDTDTASAEPVVVVTERAAARFWPGQDAVGKRLKSGFGRPADQTWASVVGVVREVKQYALSGDGLAAIYMPLSQAPHPVLLSQMTYVVRNGPASGSNPEREFRDAVQSVDPDLPLSRVAAMDELIGFSVSEPRFRTALITAFAVTALLLVAAGLSGVLMYSVARRTREIGVRIAVGAAPAAVALLVIREMLTVTIAGMAVGLTGAVAAAALIRNLLFAVEPTDPATLVFAAGFVLLICSAASYVPARRAARIDPAVTLKAS